MANLSREASPVESSRKRHVGVAGFAERREPPWLAVEEHAMRRRVRLSHVGALA